MNLAGAWSLLMVLTEGRSIWLGHSLGVGSPDVHYFRYLEALSIGQVRVQ